MNKQFLTLIIIVAAATVMYLISGRFQTQSVSIPCTQEAKICSDGTTIKRSGPNCLFSACPIVNNPISPTIKNTKINIIKQITPTQGAAY